MEPQQPDDPAFFQEASLSSAGLHRQVVGSVLINRFNKEMIAHARKRKESGKRN